MTAASHQARLLSLLRAVPPWKRVVACLVLALAGAWPLVHRVWTPAHDVHPWKLAGWAMYATPTLPALVALFELRDGTLHPIDERALPAPSKEALVLYRKRRNALGDLTVPDMLARKLFAQRAELETFGVVVQRLSLDRATARMTSTKQDYWYERGTFLETSTFSMTGLIDAQRRRQASPANSTEPSRP